MSKRGSLFSAMVIAVLGAVMSLQVSAAEPAKYAVSCGACHNTAVAGAPKTHDPDAWKPRMEKGMDALIASVKNGMNVMPAKGNCADCTDEEYKELIEYMAKPKPE